MIETLNSSKESINCVVCGEAFISYIREKRKYCSYACMGVANRNRVELKCDMCGKPCIKNKREAQQKHHFCDRVCLNEHRKNNGGTRYKHGLSYSDEHAIWGGMKDRCYNPNSSSYRNYGHRGIKICPRWKDSFEMFYIDMGSRPSKKHSIDRIDPNGNYEPTNCRWATTGEQANNRRSSLRIYFEGENFSIRELSDRYGVPYDTILYRVKSGLKGADIIKPISTNENRFCKYGHLIADKPYIHASSKRECRLCVRRRYKEYSQRLKLKQSVVA